jgi:DNA-binding GntR family transcriptional regulator
MLNAAEKITPVNVMLLRDNIAKIHTIPQSNTIEIAKQLQDFHGIIIKSINNDSLVQIYNSLYHKFIFILNRYPPTDIDDGVSGQHQHLCDLMEAHDVELTWKLALEHSRRTLAIRAKRYLG